MPSPWLSRPGRLLRVLPRLPGRHSAAQPDPAPPGQVPSGYAQGRADLQLTHAPPGEPVQEQRLRALLDAGTIRELPDRIIPWRYGAERVQINEHTVGWRPAPPPDPEEPR